MTGEAEPPTKGSVFDYCWCGFWALTSTFIAVMMPVVLVQLSADELLFDAQSVSGEGVVVNRDCKTMSGGGDRQTCRHEVRYAAKDGTQHTFVEPTPQQVAIGQRVKVLYVPDDPENARIDSPDTEQGILIYFIVFPIMGLIFLVIASMSWRAIYRMIRAT